MEIRMVALIRRLRSVTELFCHKKFEEGTREFIPVVNPMNTSKTCNACGLIHEMPLDKRVMDCRCGYKEDRDINAAKNILSLGLQTLAKA
jgi:putative transposase